MTDYYKEILLWATWVYSYLSLSGSSVYAYWLIVSICSYFPELHSNWLCSWSDLRFQEFVKIVLYVIFLITYQNFFCIQGKHRFTRRWPSYVTIGFMEVQKWWIWEKREKIPLGTHRVTCTFYSHISHFLIFSRAASPPGTPQGRTFMKHCLPMALHPHSQGSNSWHESFYVISFIPTYAYAFR